MTKSQEFSEKVIERMRALGFWRDDGKPDVLAFSRCFGYGHSYVYRWIKGQIPRGATLVQFARDLGVPVEYLVGNPEPPGPRRPPVPIAGGSAAAAPLPVENATQHNPDWEGVEGQESKGNQPLNAMRLIRSWARNAWWSSLTWGTMRPVLA